MNIFTCTVDFDNESAVAHLSGELDMSTVACLVDRLCPLAAMGRDIVVDLSGLSFLGTAGVVAFCELQRSATAAGGSVRLSEVPTPARRALAVTGMQDRFTIVAHTVAGCAPSRNAMTGFASQQ
jgi:anti-sigma B factor antagonist